MKNIKSILALALVGSISVSGTIYANPAFSRTQEEWDKLKDNKLEYGEIQGLIEEYNATVLKNNINYNKFRKDVGDTNSKVAEKYREMANEIESKMQEPDPDSPSYVSQLASKASSYATVENLKKSADTSLEDSQIQRYNFDAAKYQLVQVAENNMITYYNDMSAIDNAKLAKEKAELDLNLANVKFSSGKATNTGVLDAKEALLKSTQNISSAEADFNSVRSKLMVMCGWSFDANPEFGALPDINFEERINAMDTAKDTQTAIDNNYTLKANLRKLENSRSADQKDELNKTIANNKSTIATTMTTAYQNVLSARDAYNYAISNANLQDTNLQMINKKFSLGAVSKYDLQVQEVTKKQADIASLQARYALFTAINNYEWNLKGLAKAE